MLVSSRCNSCTKSRIGLSENRLHSICCLSPEKAVECMTGKEDHYSGIYSIPEFRLFAEVKSAICQGWLDSQIKKNKGAKDE